tara:strand:- start:9675 stop:12083 length:2409 start_codon:yes stop_codon:yes gene_type:complete
MAVEPALQVGIEAITEEAPQDIEVAAGEPETAVDIEIKDDGSVEVVMGGDAEDVPDTGFNINLAENMGEDELTSIADDLINSFNSDDDSRTEWKKTYEDGLNLLGLKIEERTEPWDGACGVYHPLLSEAVVRFQSEAITETFPAAGPVKAQVVGKSDKEKEKAAEQVRDDMNYRLTEEMTEYRPEHERLLWNLALAGSAFKKVYYDPAMGRQCAAFIPAEDLVVSYGSSDLNTCPRVTHIMRKTENEVKFLQVDGFYRNADLGDPGFLRTDIQKKKDDTEGVDLTEDSRYELLEMHVEYDLGEDDNQIALPYVITMDRSSLTILSIYRNWSPDDQLRRKRNHFVHYTYVPGFGFYGFGLIHLLGGHAKSGTSLLRQLVDAGTLNNLPGGLKSRGLRIKGDETPIMPGEFRDVDVPGGKILDNIAFLPYKEPSQTLLALFNNIIDQGRSMAAVSDFKGVDLNSEAPVGTTLAILERMLKVMSAVQARMHTSMKTEFRLIKDIVSQYMLTDNVEEQKAYNEVDIIPVSDPNAATMSMRVVQYQAALQLASQAPQLYDLPKLHQQMLQTLGIKDATKLVPTEEDMVPKDPVSENMALLTGKPVKAFLYQDHAAHIQTHMSAAQNPQIAKLIGQSPMANAVQGALAAHIADHVAMQYRAEVEKQMGVELPPPDQPLPEDVETKLSQMMAQASTQVQEQSAAQQAQEQAQQRAQDPLVQMQQQELAIKEAELKRKSAKDLMDAVLKNEEIETEKQIEGAKLGVELSKQQNELTEKQKTEGLKIGLQVAKDLTEPDTTKEMPNMRDGV